MISEQELQRVFSGRKVDCRLGLPPAEVTIVVVCRDRLTHVGQRRIDDQMVVAGIFFDRPRRRDPEALQAKNYGHRIFDSGSVGGADDISDRRRAIGERERGRNEKGGGAQGFEHGGDPVGWAVTRKDS